MPTTALKHLAKKANVSVERAEHLWHKAKEIVKKEYGADADNYYALVMGITKKMLRLNEEIITEDINMTEKGTIEHLLSQLLLARNVAHIHHWKVKSFAQHLALGDLYDGIGDFADELAEMYMGTFGDLEHVPADEQNTFNDRDPIDFVRQLAAFLEDQHDQVPGGFYVNKFEELQALVSKVKYKLENLR